MKYYTNKHLLNFIILSIFFCKLNMITNQFCPYHYFRNYLSDKNTGYLYNITLTHWGRVTHICVLNLAIIGSDNGLSPGQRQAIIRTNAGILLIGPLGTNFSEILISVQAFSFKKMHVKMLSAKWCPFCLGLNVLIFDRCLCSWVAETPDKYELDVKYLTHTSAQSKFLVMESLELSFSNPNHRTLFNVISQPKDTKCLDWSNHIETKTAVLNSNAF